MLARLDEHAPNRRELDIVPGSDEPRTAPVAEGRSYHFEIERSDGQTVRFSVDDTMIHTFDDPEPLVGPGHEHFGFNDWDVPVCFDNLPVTPLEGNAVNFEELDIALEELETRLERLRALYEQYFLGIEKIEPQVARKDVDRRIYVLRREKIRNTGKRFKLQTIIQRYNTFQQYWQRICREIENGTYKRHLARAERIMGADKLLTIAARRRFGRATVDSSRRGREPPQSTKAPSTRSRTATEARSDPPPVFEPGAGTDRAPLPPIPRTSTPAPGQFPGTVPPNAPPRTARPSKYESLSLDMDFSIRGTRKRRFARATAAARPTRAPPEPKSAVEPRRPAAAPPREPKAAPPPERSRVARPRPSPPRVSRRQSPRVCRA